MIKKFTLAAILLLAVVMATTPLANARRGNHALRGMAADMRTNLTDEQRAAIQEKVTELKESGANRQEIRTAVAEMLKEYGIEVPDAWFNRLGKGNYLCADLTDEQRTTIQEKVTGMKEDGASREDIRAAVAEMLKEFGIELPDKQANRQGIQGRRPGRRGNANYLGADLTDEQRTAIKEKIAEMKEAGASRKEIREAVAEMLKEYGVEPPDRQAGRRGKGNRLGTNLTDEQRTTVKEKVTEMKEAGASREDIREAVAEMLKEYGIEVPERQVDHPFADLTDEQRTAIQEKVSEMKEAGASREDIREVVAEMLKGYDIELPDREPGGKGSKRGIKNGRRGANNGTNRRANLLAKVDLAMVDAEIAAAPQAAPQNTSKITTWGKLKTSR